MKKTIRLALFSLAGISLAGAFLLLLGTREPIYRGKRISDWVEDLDYGLSSFKSSAVGEAEAAVRHMGSNAVPSLIRMMRCRDSALRKKLVPWLSKQTLVKLNFRPAAEHIQWRGARGAWLVGPSAKEAIPDLIVLLTNQSPWVRATAAVALGKIGTNSVVALSSLVKALDDPVADVRNCTALALQDIGSAAHGAVPALVRHLGDSDPQTRSIVIGAILSVTNDRSLVIPVLLRQLNDPLADTRGSAVARLGSFGRQAQFAVPELANLLHDRDKAVRRATTNALNDIEGRSEANTKTDKIAFRFVNAPVDQVLRIYGELITNRVEIASDVRRSTPITIKCYGGAVREEALRLIEEELNEQANILITRTDDGVVSAKNKPPRIN